MITSLKEHTAIHHCQTILSQILGRFIFPFLKITSFLNLMYLLIPLYPDSHLLALPHTPLQSKVKQISLILPKTNFKTHLLSLPPFLCFLRFVYLFVIIMFAEPMMCFQHHWFSKHKCSLTRFQAPSRCQEYSSE